MDSFFGIGMPELVLILVIAGIVMGPERIGHVARWLGKTTAQLQAISRGFVQQLQNEIDGIDDGESLKEAMNEVNALRKELQNLRTEFTTVTTSVAKDKKEVIEVLENSIRPPSLLPSPKKEVADDKKVETAVAVNGTKNGEETSVPPVLPTPIDISDDPE